MKMRASFTAAALAVAVVIVGCSSSSGGGAPSTPTCKGGAGATGAGSTACNSCTQSSCGSQIAAIEGACSAFLSCYEACECTDLACLGNCQTSIDATCMSAYNPFVSCLTQSCASQCAGGSSGDGG